LAEYARLDDEEWLLDLAFLTDITHMLNELNLELQGKDRTVVDMISSVNAFKRRLHLLCSKLQRKDLANFKNIASELEKQGKDSALLDSARYTEQVNNITSDFEKRFRDFALLEPIATFMCYPFSEDHDIDSLAQNIGAVFHLNPSALEDEMLSLQADIQLKARAHARQFWNLFRVEKYPNIRRQKINQKTTGEGRLRRQSQEKGPTGKEILVSSEEEDGEKQPFISSAMAASQWCSAKNMGGKVILPQSLSMAPLDREAALHNLGEAVFVPQVAGRRQLGRQDGPIYVQVQI
ncbi:hypothetical protein JOQ06_024330, partial [Pogonophryne albipinna]